MSSRRLFVLAVLLVVAAAGAYVYLRRPHAAADSVGVYYTKLDGTTLGSYRVSLGPARDLRSVAFYAATQCLAGPPPTIQAIRFPPGTHVLSLSVSGTTARIDISKEVESSGAGGFDESGEFKALVWTLTDLPGISAVDVRVAGTKTATLPGGHFELDEPLTRSSW